MLRGGPSAQDNKQKQKKRLSFKDPEIEGPLRNRIYQSRTLTGPTKILPRKAATASLEDLTLEDQALQIAQNVGSAFSDLSLADNGAADYAAFEEQRETEIRDNSPAEFEACQSQNFETEAEEEEFLVQPLFDQIMRGPPFESGSDPGPTKNCIPSESTHSVQHQVQLLRYQLEQQNQQTQMAMHQVQLLQDQVNAESAARRKAQEQNNHLMHQNQELLSHIERLFQQIEDLERQIHLLEQRGQVTGRRAPPSGEIRVREESKTPITKQPIGMIRPRTEHVNEKQMAPNRSLAARRSSLTSMKPLACTTSKTSPTQNSTPTPAARKIPSITSSRPSLVPAKPKDLGTKEKETLRIGDASPPVQSSAGSPFESSWRLKSQDSSAQSRSRAGSFSSYVKKPQDTSTAKKSGLFDSNHSSFSVASMSGKKHSSSTSDLYNPPSAAFQGKSSLMIDEPPSGVKSAVSSLSISSISKLPRYQPYTGWQRKTSMASEEDQVSAISKDSYKSSQQTSLFNR